MTPTIDEIVRVTVENRLPLEVDHILSRNALSQMLYADSRKYSRWELFVKRMKDRRDRVRDAWLVLAGRAEIGDW